jgi:hypothetical protein
MKVENLKHPFILWGNCGDFWRNFSLNREFVTGYSFFRIFFAKLAKIRYQKIMRKKFF